MDKAPLSFCVRKLAFCELVHVARFLLRVTGAKRYFAPQSAIPCSLFSLH